MERRPGLTSASGTPESAPVVADIEDAALAAGGDARAFERLYRAHVARIHSLVRRMLGDQEPAEVTQDVFVRAWQKIGTFRGEAAFGTWLHRLAVNVVLSRRAALGLRRSRFIDEEDVLESLPSRPVSRDFGLDFETAITRLPQGARHIFVLHDVEGYRHEEIAALLGVTTGTTKAQLHRARLLLRRHLGAEGVTQ
jgi:RNA polymerase sigma-70 factor (ECF subfamily)